jgi:hypothetical protein
MPILRSREMLIVDLRTYGEDDVAAAVGDATDEQLRQIGERADHYVYSDEFATPSGASPLLSWALARAAVEVIEGAPRDLRWKRRKLKGIYPGC